MLGSSTTATQTLDRISCLKVLTQRGTTYVVPCACDGDSGTMDSCTCVLENSFIVSLLANGLVIKNVRYIEDGVRPAFLIEI